jgi:hypothetical protein
MIATANIPVTGLAILTSLLPVLKIGDAATIASRVLQQ